MRVRLVDRGEVVVERTFDRPRIVVGRLPTADIQIAHGAISKTHSVLYRHGDVVIVCDAMSNPGTRIDGRPVQRVVLRPGQFIDYATLGELHVDGNRELTSIAELLATTPLPADPVLFQLALIDEDATRPYAERVMDRRDLDISAIDLMTVRKAELTRLASELAARRAGAPTTVDEKDALVASVAALADADRVAAATSTATDEATLKVLARDPSHDVRLALTIRPLSARVLEVLQADADRDVRLRAAWMHGLLPLPVRGVAWLENDAAVASGGVERGVTTPEFRVTTNVNGEITIAGVQQTYQLFGAFKPRPFIGPTPRLRIDVKADTFVLGGRAVPSKPRVTLLWTWPDRLTCAVRMDGDEVTHTGDGTFRPDLPCVMPPLSGPTPLQFSISDAGLLGALVRRFLGAWH